MRAYQHAPVGLPNPPKGCGLILHLDLLSTHSWRAELAGPSLSRGYRRLMPYAYGE
jgi:hypothetical protein